MAEALVVPAITCHIYAIAERGFTNWNLGMDSNTSTGSIARGWLSHFGIHYLIAIDGY